MGMINLMTDNNLKEEIDSSKEMWKYYNYIYSKHNFSVVDMFDFKNVCTYSEKIDKEQTKGLIRNLAYIKTENNDNNIKKFGKMISLGGDCDFNFKSNKRRLFKKIIRNSKLDKKNEEKLIEKLDKCGLMHHNKLNLSIMLTTGGMNNLKGNTYFDEGTIKYNNDKNNKVLKNISYDRLDTFIYCLNDFFETKGKNDFILKASSERNKPYLQAYLNDKFNDVYDYCNKIYFIDKEFVDELIENGEKSIKNYKDLNRYMDLAMKYWKIKESNINDVLTKTFEHKVK